MIPLIADALTDAVFADGLDVGGDTGFQEQPAVSHGFGSSAERMLTDR
jgi:hypothetical protein